MLVTTGADTAGPIAPILDAMGVPSRRNRPPMSSVWISIEVTLGVILLGGAALAGYAFVHRPWENRLDVAGFAAFPAVPNSRHWHLIADIGTLPVLLVGIALSIAFSVWRDRARALACLVGPIAAVLVTERIAKPLVGRVVTPFGGFSYPSGTVTAATALVVVVVLALPLMLRPFAAVAGLAVVAAVGCAVVALRWHFPTDAVGGALVGAGSVLFLDGLLHVPGLVRARYRHPDARRTKTFLAS
ncbi:MAG: putative rane protein [Acidimicrobiaceae bacterium]|nr:putative rane protein [Acidimicrobiaceae bacterium]